MGRKQYYHPQGKRTKGKRSKLEAQIEEQLKALGCQYEYESKKYRYYSSHQYTPDFVLGNGILLEVKGWFTAADRTKLMAIRKFYPEIDLRLVFGKNNKIHKKSETRYSDWCERHGFLYSIGEVPEEWTKEEPKELPKSYKKSVNKLLKDGSLES